MPIEPDILRRLRENDLSLTHLDLPCKKLTDRDISILCDALESNTTLTTLNLRHNNIGDAGAQALAGNTTLTTLSLWNNNIGDAGAQALARSTTLTTLSLWNNNIGAAGAQALARNTTLTTLYLEGNNIGAAGAQALARNTTLTTLNLRHNNIGDAGAQALAGNTTLTTLSLWNNNIGDAGAQALARSTTLTTLSLWNNNIGDAGDAAIKAMLTRNRALAQRVGFSLNNPATVEPVLRPIAKPTLKPLSSFSEIKPQDITGKKQIGRGGFGVVYAAKWLGTTVAVKELQIQGDAKIDKEFAREIRQLSRLSHDHIIAFRGIVVGTQVQAQGLVMEYAKNGDLASVMYCDRDFPWSARRRISREIALALTYLHQQTPTVVHSDLKPENVLLATGHTVKLADFGLAKTKATVINSTARGVGGTPTHIAPELFDTVPGKPPPQATPESDMYGFAVILLGMATRERPYEGFTLVQIMRFVSEGKRLPIPAEAPQYCQSIITRCWAQDPSARMDAQAAACALRPGAEAENAALDEQGYPRMEGMMASVSMMAGAVTGTVRRIFGY